MKIAIPRKFQMISKSTMAITIKPPIQIWRSLDKTDGGASGERRQEGNGYQQGGRPGKLTKR
jgi:hypothetical protein